MKKCQVFHSLTIILLVPLLCLAGCEQENAETASETVSASSKPSQPPSSIENGVNTQTDSVTAETILGNPDYPALSYGGYRETTRDSVPSVDQLKEDMRILSAMGIKLIRTYNTQQYAHAANLLEAIDQLRNENPDFEMYVMLGAWIDCEGAWTDKVNHEAGSVSNNTAEIDAAVLLAKKYPNIVKIIAVGNEAMVHWAASYFVRPAVILKWVNHLQQLKTTGELPANLWITSSDNFASWGGGDESYHTKDLTALIKAVDFVSMHTYPFHDSHYNSDYWVAPEDESDLPVAEKAEAAMSRASAYAMDQYKKTADYIESLGIKKPIHIGETGWASISNSLYGPKGSRAADEYKSKLYHEAMREWTTEAGLSCFYFEAFDEPWKDAGNEGGSENHFGLINIKGQAKYVLWDEVDAGTFKGLTRGGSPITKTFDGDEQALLDSVLKVPGPNDLGSLTISTVNDQRSAGVEVTEKNYVVINKSMIPDSSNDMTYPSENLKLNVWEGTCGMEMSSEGVIRVSPGTGQWWGCGLEIQGGGEGENLSQFKTGHLHFEIRGETKSPFSIGFQTGLYSNNTQTNNSANFGPEAKNQLTENWKAYSIPVSELDQGADLADVTSLLFLRGDRSADSGSIEVRNVTYSQD